MCHSHQIKALGTENSILSVTTNLYLIYIYSDFSFHYWVKAFIHSFLTSYNIIFSQLLKDKLVP